MRISIIGGGIGGLSSAIALKKNGHDVTVFERVTKIKPVGAALSIWANGIKCLNYLGLRETISEIGGQMDSMAYINGLDGSTMTQFSLIPLHDEVGQRSYPITRAQLQSALIEKLGPENLKLGMCLKSISQGEDTVAAFFENGENVESDLLIGADGAHSIVRNFIQEGEIERRYAGYVNWNGLVSIKNVSRKDIWSGLVSFGKDKYLAPPQQWTTFVAEGKRVSVMPVSNERFYFFFDVPLEKGLANDKSTYKQTLHEYFKGWIEPVHNLIDNIDENTTNRIEIHDIEPQFMWSSGRIVMIGDAAHNSTPDLGQGGCMAIEDSVVLSWCLEASDIEPKEILKRFEKLRAHRCSDLVYRARKRSDITHAIDVDGNRKWYEELVSEDGDNIKRAIAKTILGGPFQ